MIKTIELQNFKSHRDTKIELDDSRLHAIVGQNSSGKTSVLQGLHYLSLLGKLSFSKIFEGKHEPDYLVTKGQTYIGMTVGGYWKEKKWELAYAWEKLAIWTPHISWDTNNNKQHFGGHTNTHNWLLNESFKLPDVFNSTLHNIVFLKLIAKNLTQATYSDDVVPQIGHDGMGLASTLDYLRSDNFESFDRLQKLLQGIIPTIQKITIRRAKVPIQRERVIEVDGKVIPYEDSYELIGQEVVFDMKSGKQIPAHAISEGTIITLGLLTVLMNPQNPNLVLLDDVEQGLHPKAQRDLIKVFKKILDLKPELQIIFTTHSPYIVDELEPSQVHVLHNDKEGYTFAKRLDEHPNIEEGLQVLTTGEFWDAEGEEWVLEGEKIG